MNSFEVPDWNLKKGAREVAVISHSELSKKLIELEKKYDSQFKVVFEAIEQLMIIPEISQKKIGI